MDALSNRNRLALDLNFAIRPEPALRLCLDNKFRRQFPLAPSYPGKTGKITKENYQQANSAFGAAATRFHLNEITCLKQETTNFDFSKVLHLGLGEGHDLDYLPEALQLRLDIALVDASNVVCRRIERMIKTIVYGDVHFGTTVEIILADAEKFCTVENCFDKHGTKLVYASRILQFMERPNMQNTLRGAARMFDGSPKSLVVIHPLPDDNPDVQWVRTKAHSLSEIIQPLEEGAERTVTLVRSEKIPYYSQVYTAMTFRAI